jgi:signal transduction histidine kinase
VLVSDSGTGIADGKLTDIFEPFYTTKPQGTGLGLSISRTIVETFGGKIWAENRPEGGATLRFTLPIAKAGVS